MCSKWSMDQWGCRNGDLSFRTLMNEFLVSNNIFLMCTVNYSEKYTNYPTDDCYPLLASK